MPDSSTPMPNRERFKAICRGQRPGDFMVMDWFHRCWADTLEEWIKSGAPESIWTQEGMNE